MSTKIPKDVVEERLRWVKPIVDKHIKLVDVMKVFPNSQRTLERWIANYKRDGVSGLKPKSTRPKTNPNETSIRIKERIIELRKLKSNKCSIKLKIDLKKEGIILHERTIGKILSNEGLVRKYRIRKLKYKYLKVPLAPGELIEIDVKYVPKKLDEKKYY